MIITIRKDDGTVTYDTSMIEDDSNKNNANTIIIGSNQYFFLTFTNSQNSFIKLI